MGSARPTAVGLDVGGSTSRAAAGRAGEVLVTARGDSANIAAVGRATAQARLDTLVAQLGDVSRVGSVCVGAAGSDSASGRQDVTGMLRRHFPHARIEVVHDAALALAVADLAAGIVLVAGTGSAAWGRDALGTSARSGGWGWVLGDDGGGFGLARAAVRHVLDRSDAGLAPDTLSRATLDAAGVDVPAELIHAFYAEAVPQVWARRASVVLDLAGVGDPAARGLVAAAVDSLVLLATRVAARLTGALPVVLSGGLVTGHASVRTAVCDALARAGFDEVRVIDGEPVMGALRLAERAGR